MLKFSNKLVVFFVLPFVFVQCSCWRSSKNQSGNVEKVSVQTQDSEEARLYYKFLKKEGVNWLAHAGDITVSQKEVRNLTFFKGVEAKKSELLFALIYQKYVAYEKNPPRKITLFIGDFGRDVASLVNQYGLPLREQSKIVFADKTEDSTIARIDNTTIELKDLDHNHFLWGKIQTIEFQALLKGVDQLVKQKRVLQESRRQNMNVQDYKEEYIYKNIPKEFSSEELEKVRSEKNYSKNKEGRNSAKKWLLKVYQDKHYNYYLEKYLLELPIVVSLTPPKFNLEIESDFVPHFGPSQSEVELTLFTDPGYSVSNEIASQIEALLNEYRGIRIELRPILSSQNSFHQLRSEIDFCVWKNFPDQFLAYYTKTRTDFKTKTHEKLFNRIESLQLSKKSIETCLHGEEVKEAMDYHKKYARYLGIMSGPIVFVSGEVLGPQVSLENVKKVINRQLQRSDAALW